MQSLRKTRMRMFPNVLFLWVYVFRKRHPDGGGGVSCLYGWSNILISSVHCALRQAFIIRICAARYTGYPASLRIDWHYPATPAPADADATPAGWCEMGRQDEWKCHYLCRVPSLRGHFFRLLSHRRGGELVPAPRPLPLAAAAVISRNVIP